MLRTCVLHIHVSPSYLLGTSSSLSVLLFLFATLTVLFLILPGVSGNRTGFYWVNIEYEGYEGAWKVGALGSCQYGTEYVFPFSLFLPVRGIERRGDSDESGPWRLLPSISSSAGQTNPPYWGSIHSLLIFHMACTFIIPFIPSMCGAGSRLTNHTLNIKQLPQYSSSPPALLLPYLIFRPPLLLWSTTRSPPNLAHFSIVSWWSPISWWHIGSSWKEMWRA